MTEVNYHYTIVIVPASIHLTVFNVFAAGAYKQIIGPF